MLDEKKRQEIEQGTAMLVEVYPALWKQLFDGLLKQGFSNEQALVLVREYISATCNS